MWLLLEMLGWITDEVVDGCKGYEECMVQYGLQV